jgi:hypothetical protein
MKDSWRPTRSWDWAAINASAFHGILPHHVSQAAMATCRFTLVGSTIAARLQTFGYEPHGVVTAKKNHHWLTVASKRDANVILACFGLDVDDVFSVYGKSDDKVELDLADVVQTLAVELDTRMVESVA